MNNLSLDDIMNSVEDKTIEKVASETATEAVSVSVADELKGALTKEASCTQTEGDEMSIEQGNAIAEAVLGLLTKQASENPVEAQLDEAVKADDKKVEEQKDLEATEVIADVEKALEAGEAPVEKEEIEEVAKGATQDGEQVMTQNIEKVAAITELVNEGYDFADAANIVEEAAFELEKEAAVAELMDEGYNMFDAVELVKEAGKIEDAKTYAKGTMGLGEHGKGYKEAVKENLKEAGKGIAVGGLSGAALGTAVGAVKKNKIGAKAGALAGLAGGAVTGMGITTEVAKHKRGMEAVKKSKMTKEAAVAELMEEGYDLFDAVELVKQAASMSQIGNKLKTLVDTKKVEGAKEVVKDVTKAVKDKATDATGIAKAKAKGVVEHIGDNKAAYGAGAAGTAAAVGAAAGAKHYMNKEAAVAELMEEGYNIFDAVELVKQASVEVEVEAPEYSELEKAAAISELVAEDGLSVEEAAYLVSLAAE